MVSALKYTWVLAVLGVLAVVGFFSLWFVTGQVGAAAQVLGVLGAIALVAYAFLDRDRIAEGTTAKEALASFSALLVVALGIILGSLLVSLASTWDQTVDLTQDGAYTLGSRTRSVLDALDEEVQIYGIFRDGTQEHERFERVASLYDDASGNVSLEMVDPLSEPMRVKALVQTTGQEELDRLSASGTVLLARGGRRRRIESRFDETTLTNAIVKLGSEQDYRVCWSVGHSERDPDDEQSPIGWGITVLRMEDRNLVVTEERILTGGVPADCAALMIIGPRTDFLPRELEAVAAYIAGGGSVLLAIDGPTPEGAVLPGLREELERYGISAGSDVIMENDENHLMQGDGGEPLYVYGAANFKQHPILEPRSIVTPAWPRSVRKVDGETPGLAVQELVASSDRSWAETGFDIQSRTLPEPNPGEILGPVPWGAVVQVLDPSALQVVAEGPPVMPEPLDTDSTYEGPAALKPQGDLIPDDFVEKPGGKLIVFGDADLGANRLTSKFGNGDVMLNAVVWLIGQEDQIGTDPSASQTLMLTATQQALFILVGAILMPLLAAGIGVSLLLRRRFL